MKLYLSKALPALREEIISHLSFVDENDSYSTYLELYKIARKAQALADSLSSEEGRERLEEIEKYCIRGAEE